jgi:hypothetical protein
MKSGFRFILLLILPLTLSVFLGSSHAYSQESKPAMVETIEWMKGKSEHVLGISSDVPKESYKYAGYMGDADVWELANYNGCSVVWKGKKKIAYQNQSSEIEITATVSFADLNPNKIEIGAGGIRLAHSQTFQRIRLFTTDRKRLVKWQFSIKETTSDYDSVKAKITGNPSKKTKEFTEAYEADTLEIRVDQEMGKRFLTAIQNAIRQCGGKPDTEEPF